MKNGTAERRSGTRVVMAFDAVDTARAVPMRGHDLSLGGACLTTSERYAVGTRLDLDVTLPGAAAPMRLWSAVTASNGSTLRVRFLDPRMPRLVKLAEALW